MNLSRQIHLYSVDTSAFYNQKELDLHNRMNEIAIMKINLKKMKPQNDDSAEHVVEDAAEQIKNCSAEFKRVKQEIREAFKQNKAVRNLNPDFLKPSNIVSMFECNASRTFGMVHGELYTDIFIVRAYFFDIIKDLIRDGFYYNGEKYIYFTSSAGQIRTKKTVFIKESLWERCSDTLMCGLSVEEINRRGGINVNKFLAYLALVSGATEPFENFDIKKTIVVDDFETLVHGEVDYIDSKTYNIERKFMDVPINHSDGCGVMLPRVSKKNFMVRLPWVKGLLSPFAFDGFCKEHGHSGDIVDIYGKTYNIFRDDIEIIFTKSQFKMNKYYTDWQSYIDNFIKYGCEAGKCNEDEDYIRNARFNYQMLQTLSDMTDDELERVTEKARNDIINISRDRATMLKVFGATKYNKNKTYLQQALETYPEMLADNYCKNILKLIKRKLVKNGRSAKFEVDGKYTFLIPDLYAFCERLFLGTEKPIGLLKDGDVFCQLFQKTKELDCLRSPHLYREHAVRKNVLDDVKRKWFITQGLYTSSYDLVSKLLQFDVDGDKSLVCADNTILEAAKRNTKGIVPIYYEMGTAKPVVVNSQKLHEGLTFAFANCNIGAVSNNITKVWNSNDINLDVIKLQCMESNFLIDAAKTLTKLERPQNMKPVIARHTRAKAPRFFIYAKDKTKEQVEATNGSVVNRLTKFIPDKRIVFDKNAFGVFEYGMLMKNTKIEVLPEIVKLYEEFKMGNKFNINVDDLEHSNIQYIYHKNRESLLSVLDNAYDVSDMLVKYLYGEMRKTDKEALWFMFGNVLLENLKCNLDERYGDSHILCERCAKRMQKINNRQKYCGDCWKELERVRAKENRNKKVRTV